MYAWVYAWVYPWVRAWVYAWVYVCMPRKCWDRGVGLAGARARASPLSNGATHRSMRRSVGTDWPKPVLPICAHACMHTLVWSSRNTCECCPMLCHNNHNVCSGGGGGNTGGGSGGSGTYNLGPGVVNGSGGGSGGGNSDGDGDSGT